MQNHTQSLNLNGNNVPVKHLDKVYSQTNQILKAEIIDYYIQIAPLLLPHIANKPFTMIHFPHGVGGKSFYQKQCPADAPPWVKTVSLLGSRQGSIDWCLVNDTASVVYMANRSVVEMHTWFSRLPNLYQPDVAVIDLDPSPHTPFTDVLTVARAFGVLLKQLGLYAVPKTSGGAGIHIYIPVKNADFNAVKAFLNKMCGIIVSIYPDIATTQRSINKRGAKIYLDAVQNAFGKTIAAPYSLRAREGLPVAAPLLWEELYDYTLTPARFNIKNIFLRLDEIGDPFKGFYAKAQDLPPL